MSIRPELRPYPVIINGDMSTNINGSATIIQKISMLSYSFSWVGSTPVGAVSIQVSNDYSIDATGNVANAGTWNTIYFVSAGSSVNSIAVTGNTGNGGIDIFQTGFYAIRPVYTKTSGTGTIQCLINGKVA